MKSNRLVPIGLLLLLATGVPAGCKKEESPSKLPSAASRPSAAPERARPQSQPSAAVDGAAEGDAGTSAAPAPEKAAATGANPTDGSTLSLNGIELTVPKGWVSESAGPGAMAPKAVYQLPAAEGAEGDADVRITYFPNMKGMNDMNIDRWVGQINKPDGTPFSRQEAKISVQPMGAITLTVIDLDGTVATDMPGQGGPASGQRMIAAIVDHPQGPHFVKALGPAESITKHADDIYAFLMSAKVSE